SSEGRIYEYGQKLQLAGGANGGTSDLGSIRVGVQPLFIRRQLEESLQAPMYTAIGVVLIASLVAMVPAQIVLRPTHVLRSGLARLGRGELNVHVDLPPEGELADLGD